MDTVVGDDARVIQCLQDYRWGPFVRKGIAFPVGMHMVDGSFLGACHFAMW